VVSATLPTKRLAELPVASGAKGVVEVEDWSAPKALNPAAARQ